MIHNVQLSDYLIKIFLLKIFFRESKIILLNIKILLIAFFNEEMSRTYL